MKSQVLLAALFQSKTRAALVELLFEKRVSGSVSELARRAGLSVRTVANEVRHLVGLGLVEVERVGSADVVRGELRHPAVRHLVALLGLELEVEPADPALRSSLVAWGAPLADRAAERPLPLEEAFVGGLALARHDGTVLRALPTLLARRVEDFDWVALKEAAKRARLTAELGAVTELTGQLLERDDLKARVADLIDRRRKLDRYYPQTRSSYERKLARERSPAVVRRWRLLMNVSEQSFRSTLERHA